MTPSPEELSATPDVLRRVAAAVAGDVSGLEMFVVCDTDRATQPWGIDVVHVQGGDREAARTAANAIKQGKGARADAFVVLGPYRNESTISSSGKDVGSSVFVAMKPPGTNPPNVPTGLGGLIADVSGVTVTLSYANGTQSAPYPSTGYAEAIFLSLTALERYYFPYLARVYGTEVAASQRELWKNAISQLIPE